jgi:hypothetical protein
MLRGQDIVRVVNLSGGSAGAGLEETLLLSSAAGGYYITYANVDFEGIGMPGWAEREILRLE